MATDLISRQQLTASFRGVEFSIRSESVGPTGKRHIPHEYPNSNRRFIEDLGEIPPVFNITGFVHGTDYLQRAQQLAESLRQDGTGVLSMPNFGTFRAYAMPFTQRASQTAVGEIVFGMSFQVGTDTVAPSLAAFSQEDVFDAADRAREAINTDFAAIYEVPTDTEGVSTIIEDVQSITDQVLEGYENLVSDLEPLRDAAESITDDINSIVRSGQDLAGIFFGGNGLFQIASELLSPVFAGLQAANTLAYIGREIRMWPETTRLRIQRNLNRTNIFSSSRTASLVASYEQAAGTTYNTDQEVREARILVETAHKAIMQDDVENRNLVQSRPVTRNAVENVRNLALGVLDQKEQQAFILTQIRQPVSTNANLLAHRFYAESLTNDTDLTTRANLIRDLNRGQQSNAIFGDVTIVQV